MGIRKRTQTQAPRPQRAPSAARNTQPVRLGAPTRKAVSSAAARSPPRVNTRAVARHTAARAPISSQWCRTSVLGAHAPVSGSSRMGRTSPTAGASRMPW